MKFPDNPSHGDIHIEDLEIYVYDSTLQKLETTGAWRRNESEIEYIDYLKQALIDIHYLKKKVSKLEDSDNPHK